MPHDKAGMDALLSEDFKKMIHDPRFGIPQSPITGEYSAEV